MYGLNIFFFVRVCVCVVCARCMYVQQQRAMHCELKETGWVDLSRQVPTC